MGFNVEKDEDEAQVNELVAVIDRLMMGGQGHLTIDIDETEEGLNVPIVAVTARRLAVSLQKRTLLTEMKINSLF
mgnify:CR=1 FL=1